MYLIFYRQTDFGNDAWFVVSSVVADGLGYDICRHIQDKIFLHARRVNLLWYGDDMSNHKP